MMKRKIERTEISPGFNIVTTRGASPFADEVRKEAKRITRRKPTIPTRKPSQKRVVDN